MVGYSDRWRVLVSALMNLRLHTMRAISCLAEDLLASQKGLCSMELVSQLVSRSVNQISIYQVRMPVGLSMTLTKISTRSGVILLVIDVAVDGHYSCLFFWKNSVQPYVGSAPHFFSFQCFKFCIALRLFKSLRSAVGTHATARDPSTALS